jgi:hypothetical protein
MLRNLKEIKQIPGEIVREYDKIFKYFLSQIPHVIDEKLLVQWYVSRIATENQSSIKDV